MSYNPYEPPTSPLAGARVNALPIDATDLYVETLPSAVVRGAGICAGLTGLTLLFSCMRFVLSGARGTTIWGFEALLVACALVELGVAWGVTGGRLGWLVIGLALAPVVFAASLFVLVTGAFVGMFGMSLALVGLTLLAVALPKVRRMGRARAEMRRLEKLEAG